MSIVFKQEEDIFTIEVKEKFAFEDEKTAKDFMQDFIDKKVNYAQYKQLKNKKKEEKFVTMKDSFEEGLSEIAEKFIKKPKKEGK